MPSDDKNKKLLHTHLVQSIFGVQKRAHTYYLPSFDWFVFLKCVSQCFNIWSFRIKPLPHVWHWNGFLPVCRHMCRRKSVLWLNCFGHLQKHHSQSPKSQKTTPRAPKTRTRVVVAPKNPHPSTSQTISARKYASHPTKICNQISRNTPKSPKTRTPIVVAANKHHHATSRSISAWNDGSHPTKIYNQISRNSPKSPKTRTRIVVATKNHHQSTCQTI